MKSPPRVFSLIKMSVKSLPVNQCLTAVPAPILPPPPLIFSSLTPRMHMRYPHNSIKFKKKTPKKQVTVYLCAWLCVHVLPHECLSSRSSWKVKYFSCGLLLVWHRCEWHCVCAAERKNVILNVSHKSASQLL